MIVIALTVPSTAYTQTRLVPKKIGSITTNASGYGSYSKYVDASASYYAKETKAPKGYELDETVYTFVNSGKKAADGTKNL